LGGCTPFMVANALAASLTAFVLGVKVEQIRAALHSFQASAWQTAGEMPLQMQLFNPDYYQFELLKHYSDFKDEQETTQAALRLQHVLTQPSVPYASTNAWCAAIALENERNDLKSKALPQDQNSELTTVASALTEGGSFDFPTVETNPVEPAHHFERTVKTQTHSSHSRLDSGAKAIAPQCKGVRKTLKHYGFKVWAVNRGVKAKNWAKEKLTLNTVQTFAQQAFDIGEIVGVVAFAFGSVAAEMAYKKGKELGAIALEKLNQAAAAHSADPHSPSA
jgi:hypothetical protein